MRAELTGKTFGRLLVLGFSRSVPRGVHSSKVYWDCLCACGTPIDVLADNLRSGNTVSCGCMRGKRIRPAFASGHPRSAEHLAWRNMWMRCTQETYVRFKDWGGRGITVCEEWRVFEPFFEYVGPRPSLRHSIDRIDNDGNYEPGNVHWATPSQQRRNRRDCQRIDGGQRGASV